VDDITRITDSTSAELKRRLPGQCRTQREKLALLMATMLDVRSANLMNLAAGLQRAAPGRLPCESACAVRRRRLRLDCDLA
jgi:hypothetical protein